jgi:antitoxin FitA
MPTITVRNLDEDVQRQLKIRAKRNNRSMEAEARAILTAAVDQQGFGRAWLQATEDLRGAPLPIPARSEPREIDLS